MPDQSTRDLYDEIATLRQEVASARAERDELGQALDREHVLNKRLVGIKVDLEAERDAAQRERDRARRALAEHADCDECEPEIKAALGLGPDPVEAKLDRIVEAANRVVQLVDLGTDAIGIGGAIAELRRALRGPA